MLTPLLWPTLLLAAALPQQRDDTLRLEFQNRLGVKTEISVVSATTGNRLLDAASGPHYGPPDGSDRLVLRSGVAYYMVPWRLLRDVALEGTQQLITLADGAQFRGRLVTVVRTGGADPKTYDLSGATHVSVVTVKTALSPSNLPRDKWLLSLAAGADQTQSVVGPTFAIEYWSSEGYAMGGSDRQRLVRGFKVALGADTVLANPTDFATLTYWVRASQDTIEVQAPAGAPSRGKFLLSERDDRGEHQVSRWLLIGDLASGVRLAVDGRQGWKLSRSP